MRRNDSTRRLEARRAGSEEGTPAGGAANPPASRPSSKAGTVENRSLDKRKYVSLYTAVPFAAVHLAALGALWTGVSWKDALCCLLLYLVRMFGVTAGYHRYFSHHSFKTSRVGAFLLGLLAETSAQRGILWWSMHHRSHHQHSETERDPHSPARDGFWYAHLGWLCAADNDRDVHAKVPDLARYPELVWLDRLWILPPALLAVAVWALLGWSGLWIGFFLSTVLVWHAAFSINSVAHLYGRRRYATPDASRNNWILALVTLGEGWHNNHHRYMDAARQGLKRWEVDVTFFLLKLLSRLKIVWDLRVPDDSGRAFAVHKSWQ